MRKGQYRGIMELWHDGALIRSRRFECIYRRKEYLKSWLRQYKLEGVANVYMIIKPDHTEHDDIYKCTDCGMIFITLDQLATHRKIKAATLHYRMKNKKDVNIERL